MLVFGIGIRRVKLWGVAKSLGRKQRSIGQIAGAATTCFWPSVTIFSAHGECCHLLGLTTFSGCGDAEHTRLSDGDSEERRVA